MKKIYLVLIAVLTAFSSVQAQYMTLYENDFAQETIGYHLGTELTPNPWTGINTTNTFWQKETADGLKFGDWRGVNLGANPLVNWVEGKKVRFTMGLYLAADRAAGNNFRCGLVVADGAENVVPKVGFELASYTAAGGMNISINGSTYTTAPIANGTLVTMEYEVTRSEVDGEFNTVLVVKNGATSILNETVMCTDAELYNNAVNGNSSIFTCFNKATVGMAFWSSFKLEMESSVVLLADAGASQSVNSGDAVSLQASASYDGNPVADATYMWEAPEGISLSGANTATPSFTAPTTGRITELLLKVTATADVGGGVQTAEAYTTVTVNPDQIFGTTVAPYEISTADHLFNLILSGSTYLTSDFVLTADIDLTGEDYYTPIGDYQGTFDGQNHTITGLKMMEESGHVGLFTRIKWGALVKNLGLVNPNIQNTGAGSTGGIVGYLDADLVENCFVIGGTINGTSRVGGIAGTCANWTGGEKTVVKNCFTYVNVMGAEPAGLIGASNGGNGNMVIEDCAVYGMVKYTDTGDMGPASIDGTPTDIVLTDIYFKEGVVKASAISGETELMTSELGDISSYTGLDVTIWSISAKFGFAVLSAFDYSAITPDFPTDIQVSDIIDSEVYSHGKTIYINSEAKASPYQVYNVSGNMVKQGLAEGAGYNKTLDLPAGIYIVKVGATTKKVVLK